MKKLLSVIVILALTFISLVLPHKASSNEVQILKPGNNFEAWLIEDSTLPIITMRLTFKNSGSSYDPEEIAGISSLAAMLLDNGTEEMSGTEFKRELSKLASRYSFESDKDNFYINIKALSKNIDRTLELITQAIIKPKFDLEDIDRAKDQLAISIAKKNEDPDHLAEEEWNKQFFAGHPYGKPSHGNLASISNISKENLHEYVNKHFIKDNMVISAVGNIDSDALGDLISKYFTLVPDAKQNINISPITKFESVNPGSIHKLVKPTAQSAVVFGQQAIPITDKRFYALSILNFVIAGGSFESRLMQELREKRGLVYGVYSFVNPNKNAPTLKGYFATSPDKVTQAMNVLNDEFLKLKNNGISEEEFNLAKDYTIGSFPLRLDSYEKLVNYLNFMQIQDLGADFLEKRNERVKSVNYEDVVNVIDKVFNPKAMTIVVVGK